GADAKKPQVKLPPLPRLVRLLSRILDNIHGLLDLADVLIARMSWRDDEAACIQTFQAVLMSYAGWVILNSLMPLGVVIMATGLVFIGWYSDVGEMVREIVVQEWIKARGGPAVIAASSKPKRPDYIRVARTDSTTSSSTATTRLNSDVVSETTTISPSQTKATVAEVPTVQGTEVGKMNFGEFQATVVLEPYTGPPVTLQSKTLNGIPEAAEDPATAEVIARRDAELKRAAKKALDAKQEAEEAARLAEDAAEAARAANLAAAAAAAETKKIEEEVTPAVVEVVPAAATSEEPTALEKTEPAQNTAEVGLGQEQNLAPPPVDDDAKSIVSDSSENPSVVAARRLQSRLEEVAKRRENDARAAEAAAVAAAQKAADIAAKIKAAQGHDAAYAITLLASLPTNGRRSLDPSSLLSLTTSSVVPARTSSRVHSQMKSAADRNSATPPSASSPQPHLTDLKASNSFSSLRGPSSPSPNGGVTADAGINSPFEKILRDRALRRPPSDDGSSLDSINAVLTAAGALQAK
ncbi:hypothetical protein HK405_014739, partial [Cladochytrium tenue]